MSIFAEKYRPKNLKNFITNSDLRDFFNNCIESKNIPHLLLYGGAGGGKTTLAKILANSVSDDDVLFLNASNESGIDTIREKIIPFASSIGFGGLKTVILDEADFLSHKSQPALRQVIEEFSDNCRFILTCNYLNKVIDPLQSRCKPVQIIPPSKKEAAKLLIEICDKEKIKYENDYIKQIIQTNYPDLRKCINTLQMWSKNGILIIPKSETNTAFTENIVDMVLSGARLYDIRNELSSGSTNEYDSLFRALFDAIDGEKTINTAQAILIISKYQYEYAFVLDKEICIAAMLIELLNLKNQ